MMRFQPALGLNQVRDDVRRQPRLHRVLLGAGLHVALGVQHVEDLRPTSERLALLCPIRLAPMQTAEELIGLDGLPAFALEVGCRDHAA